MTKKELLEKLKNTPDDAKVLFYDCQYEHIQWPVDTVNVEEPGRIILSCEDFGI